MSSKEEVKPLSETLAATVNDAEDDTKVKEGKKPFLEPTVSASLNILDATAFFQSSAALDSSDTL